MKKTTKRAWLFPVLFLITSGKLSAQCNAAGSHLTENYASTTGWTFSDFVVAGGTTATACTGGTGTLSNGSLSIAGNQFKFITARGGRELRAHRSLPFGVSNDHWIADFTFTLDAPPAGGLVSNAPSAYLLALTSGFTPIRNSCGGGTYPTSCGAGGYTNTNMDGVWVLIGSSIPSSCTSGTTSTGWYFMAQSRNDNGTIYSSATIPLTISSTYYVRLQRTWHSQGMLSVYSDANHTNLIDAVCFDIDPAVTSLNTLQHGIVEQGNEYRILNASISNVRIDNDVTCPLSLTPSFTYNSSICFGDPITVNGTASTGNPDSETHYFWSIAECDASGVITGTPGTEWSHWYDGQAGLFTFPSAANGGPDFITCGKYYSIKLAIQNCGNVWSETSHVIYVRCGPKLTYEEPTPICQGTTVTLSVASPAIDYVWTPGNIHASSITVTPTTSTTYNVTAYDVYGCTSTATLYQEVVPSLLDVNISTGINDITAGMIAVGQNDDTWKVRCIPGTLYAGSHASLNSTKVVSPYSGTQGTWYSSSNVKWISSQSDGSGNPIEVAASQSDNTYPADNDYLFETEVNIHQKYNNLRIEISELAVDNEAYLYVNSSTSAMPEYQLLGPNTTNFSTLHVPGTVATNQSLYHSGINTVKFRVRNGGGPNWNSSYMGLLLKARLKGECDPLKMLVIEPQEENAPSTENHHLLSVFPSPNNGLFTISSAASNLQQFIITDVTGRIVKEVKNITTNKTDVDLSNQEAGIYLVKAWIEGNTKPMVKKVIVNK